MDHLIRTLDTAVAEQDIPTIQSIFRHGDGLWSTSVGQGEQRSVAAHFIVQMMAHRDFWQSSSIPELMDCFQTVLGHLPAVVEGAADNQLRQVLFQYLVDHTQEYAQAARILGGTRMESDGGSVYQMTPLAKANIYVQIAECFLAEDLTSESDAAVNKAGVFMEQIRQSTGGESSNNNKEHTALLLRYKSTLARVLDANRKFLSAAKRYHELCQSPASMVDVDERVQFLGRAVTCVLLATPMGPQKQRVLSQIAADRDGYLERLDGIPEFATHRSLLRHMELHQIIKLRDNPTLTQFEQSLQEHQKAIMGDGLTILQRAIIEHNMIAISELYESIYFEELSYLLNVSSQTAEQIAAKMIMDGSLPHAASMDQVAGWLEFAVPDKSDAHMTEFCMQLNAVAKNIQATTTTTTTTSG